MHFVHRNIYKDVYIEIPSPWLWPLVWWEGPGLCILSNCYH